MSTTAQIPPPPDGSAIVAQSGAIPPPPDGSAIVAQNNAASAAPTGTISAYHPPTTVMGKLASWIDDVTADLQDGGDRTGVGTVMQKLGARGLHNGNSAAVGDFMASLPLGLLKATKGGAELIPSEVGGEKGNTWKGVKDLVGGGLQAMQMPGMFVAPEASEQVADIAGNATAKVAKPIIDKAVALVTNIPKATESKLVDAIGDIAESNGFARSEDADTIVEATKHLATSLQQRAQAAYQALDESAPGFQELRDTIQKESQAVKAQQALDPEKASSIAKSLSDHQSQMDELLSDDQKAAWQNADKDYSQFKALQRFVGKANASATDLTSDALTDVNRLKSGMQSLGNVSRKGTPTDVLARGFGDEGAATLRQITQDASKQTADKAAAKTALKWGSGVAGAGVTGDLLYKALFSK